MARNNPGMGQYLSGLPVGETRATGELNYADLYGMVFEPSVEDREYDPKTLQLIIVTINQSK